MATAELAGQARQSDGNAFGVQMDPYRRELHVHRYRIPGSAAFITALQLLPFHNSSLARSGLPRTVQA